MARSTVESCMFCAPDPCTCFQKPKKIAKPKVVPAHPKEQSPVPLAKPDAPSSVAGPRRVALTSTAAARAAIDDERDLRRAVTLFAEFGMLDSAEVTKHSHLLDMTPTEAKLLIWKLRRREWLTRTGVPSN